MEQWRKVHGKNNPTLVKWELAVIPTLPLFLKTPCVGLSEWCSLSFTSPKTFPTWTNVLTQQQPYIYFTGYLLSELTYSFPSVLPLIKTLLHQNKCKQSHLPFLCRRPLLSSSLLSRTVGCASHVFHSIKCLAGNLQTVLLGCSCDGGGVLFYVSVGYNSRH